MSETSYPNVLFICTDHWPGSLLRCAGHAGILTPTLDQIAANGIRFPNAYSECPVCVPARRTLMTGLSPHSHGVLTNGGGGLPEVPTLAETFRTAGYQTCAVGKLHVKPQRRRLGFDEVWLDEEGRCGGKDDYELFLGDNGHPGERFGGGMCNNEYMWRPWHLEERLHVTNWAANQMSRQIIRRDPLRPFFGYLSFSHPHPPLAPLQAYLDMYRDVEIPDPVVGEWITGDPTNLPVALQRALQNMDDAGRHFTANDIRAIRRAFYALCTHIDHQLRIVLATIREHGMLGNTIICFTSDHGDMLGDHNLWAKRWMYDNSNRVPMLLSGTDEHRASGRVDHHQVDDRLVGLQDVMSTLLDLAGIEVPHHCEGLSMVGGQRREHLLGVHGPLQDPESGNPTRMLRDPRYKLVYYAAGNLRQLFDMRTDPGETTDLADDPAHAEVLERLSRKLIDSLPEDEQQAWVTAGELTGWPDVPRKKPQANTGFSAQRGMHWPS